MNKTKDKRYKKDYSKKDIIDYLKGIFKILKKSPTYRDLNNFPGPSPRTIVRRFGYWSKALKKAGIRPHTYQLIKGEPSFIRQNLRKMTDQEIAKKLGVKSYVIRYYRMNFNLWKNRKGTAKSTFRNKAFKLYGNTCEVCGLDICEWHHIIPKSTDPKYWCILCPLCHEVITRKLVILKNRRELKTKLLPFIKNVYLKLRIN